MEDEKLVEIRTANNKYYFDTRYKMVWGGILKSPQFYAAVQIDKRAIFYNDKEEQVLKTSQLAGWRVL